MGKGLCSVANCVLAPIEHLRTNNMACKAILWTTPVPTPTPHPPTIRPKQKKISCNAKHSIVGDLLIATRVLFSTAQLC
jgi:hypothetical protein